LKMKVIAEGVINQAQHDLLRAKGCDGAQGYWISHPLASEALKSWLAAYESRQ